MIIFPKHDKDKSKIGFFVNTQICLFLVDELLSLDPVSLFSTIIVIIYHNEQKGFEKKFKSHDQDKRTSTYDT